MKGLISPEEFRQKLKLEETFTRQELAFAFSDPENLVSVTHVQITRDVKILYERMFERRPIPWDVAVELYLIRLFRKERTEVYGSSYVSQQEIRDFIALFDNADDEYGAKWSYASRWGGGRDHFQREVINKIKMQRFSRHHQSGEIVNCSYVQVA